MLPPLLDLASLRALYAAGRTPIDIVHEMADRLRTYGDPAVFISTADAEQLRRQVESLLDRAPRPNSLPLWGIVCAVKDNIDVAGFDTTAACPAFAYAPDRDAFAVRRLVEAGAIVLGKTNLDQFATGLNGTRSPYGAPRCVFDDRYVSGGSSSGSGVAVAAGLVTFALGTDTAGSGRVPAAFNNIVGIKPTPGRIGTTGIVPACRSLDAVSVFAITVADGLEIRRIIEGFDADDPFSRPLRMSPLPKRPRFGILRDADRVFYGDEASAALYEAAITRFEACGAEAVPFDFAPFRATALLLYEGPWVAERLAAIERFALEHADTIDPVVRGIVESAHRFTAVDAFKGLYRLEELRRQTEATWQNVDLLLLPTAPTIYEAGAMRADPIRLNSHLGHYTNFANLLGLAAIAVPAGFRPDGLPFGVTVVAPGHADDALGAFADQLHRHAACGSGLDKGFTWPLSDGSIVEKGRLPIVVVGAHLSGMPLNHELVDLGATLLRSTRTSTDYRLFALPGTHPAKPALVRDPGFSGPGIEVEVWSLDPGAFARFVSAIPAPLSLGRIALDDGTSTQGFLCEAHAVSAAEDITPYGGWRAYVAR